MTRYLEALGVAVLVATGGVIAAVGFALVEIGRAVAEPAGRIEFVRIPNDVSELCEDEL